MRKDASHYLTHQPLSSGAFSTDKKRVSIITACSHSPATCAVLFPPFGLRSGAERQEAAVLLQPARQQRLQAHPRRAPLPQPLRALLPQSSAADAGGPRVPPPPRIPRNRAASPPARRPPHSQRRDGARSTTSGTPAGPSAPRSPVPDPPESGRASAALTRCPRPRSPASPPRWAAPLPPRGGRWHLPCAGGGGRGPGRRAGGRGRPAAGSGPGSSGVGGPEPPPLVRQAWPALGKVKGCWIKTACREK